MMDISEKDLLRKAKIGDKEAIAAIFDLHYQKVYRYLLYRVNDTFIAEDLAAEVFIKMINKVYTFSEQGRPLLAWLFTIARNLAVDFHRSSEKRDGSYLDWKDRDPKAGPAQQFQEKQAEDCFSGALTKLPEAQRLVLVYRFIEEFSTPKIIELLNKSDRAVRSLQHRALRSLEKALVEDGCL